MERGCAGYQWASWKLAGPEIVDLWGLNDPSPIISHLALRIHFAPCVADSLRTLCCEFTEASEKHKMQTKLEKARCSCLRAALVYPININK